MKILCITHADFESPGVIESWAQERGYSFKISRPYQGDNCLSEDAFDFLILMGGPQSPLTLEESPYLKDEIHLVRQAISDNKLVLGFCLGAQLIGEALGAKTERSPHKEVGVYPISLTPEGLKDPLFKDFPEVFPVIHWHNDMPGMTEQSVLIAQSEGCPRQIIRYTPLAYGLQCHMEITREGIETMVEACPGDLAPSQYTQSKGTLLTQDYKTINRIMVQILERLVVLNTGRAAA